MNINEWAEHWGIRQEALDDLKTRLCGLTSAPALAGVTGTEAGAVSHIRLEASRKGMRLWRNNTGAVYDERGNFIRYGLANESEKISKVLKSSDLIGIRPVKLTNGATIGQFVAREVKRPGWGYTGTEREVAQYNFLLLIAAMGGDAQFTTGEGSL
jgi:hypothetical protein